MSSSELGSRPTTPLSEPVIKPIKEETKLIVKEQKKKKTTVVKPKKRRVKYDEISRLEKYAELDKNHPLN